MEIKNHPNYVNLEFGIKFGFQAAVGGFSYCTKQNNKWCKALWQFLYNGINNPEYNFKFEDKNKS